MWWGQGKDSASAAGVSSRVGLEGKLVTYKGIEKMSKYVEDDGRQFSHYRRGKLQIWEGDG